MFLSAFASTLRPNPVNRADCDRIIVQGKRSGRTLIALERRRILTLHAMIRNGPLYEAPNQHTNYLPPLDTPRKSPEAQDRTRVGV
jgi:transposase, IS111A/IS1328/IS1533 (fragment)